MIRWAGHVAHLGKKNIYRIMEDLATDARIILKWISEVYDGRK